MSLRVLFVIIAAVAAFGVTVSTASATVGDVGANCELGTTPFIDTATFGGNNVASQMTFFNCANVDKIKFRYKTTTFPVSGVSDPASNFHQFRYYLGINACGSNGLKSVPVPNGIDFVCSNASGTISGGSMWGYSTAPWWSGCNLIHTRVEFALHNYQANTWGSFHQYDEPTNTTLCV